ncbi:Anaphase-promoting complex subunit 2, partial [Kappamyces sp. JEL0680]
SQPAQVDTLAALSAATFALQSQIEFIVEPLSLLKIDAPIAPLKRSLYPYLCFTWKPRFLAAMEELVQMWTNEEQEIDGESLTGLSQMLDALRCLCITDLIEGPLMDTLKGALEEKIMELSQGQHEESQLGVYLEFLNRKLCPLVSAIFPDKGMLVDQLIGAAVVNTWKKRLEYHLFRTLAYLLMENIFEIIRDYPESEASLRDLKACVTETRSETELAASITKAMGERLFIIDAKTHNILDMYLTTGKCAAFLGVSEDITARILGPIKKYLNTRHDVARVILNMILESHDAEMDEAIGEEDIKSLLNVFASLSVYAKEYQVLLAEELVNLAGFSTDTQIRNVEILKERLGDQEMAHAHVMLKDVADSRRIANHHASRSEGDKTGYSSLVISDLFWPKLDHSAHKLPKDVVQFHTLYEASFQFLKASRELHWIPNAGMVELEIARANREPLVINEILVTDALDQLGCTKAQLFEAAEFWSSQRLLTVAGEYIVSLEGLSPERLHELSEGTVEIVANQEQSLLLEQVDQIWPMVEGMLTNLGPSHPDVIHRTLSMFMPDLSLNLKQFTGVLNAMAEQEKLEVSNNVYKAPVIEPAAKLEVPSSHPARPSNDGTGNSAASIVKPDTNHGSAPQAGPKPTSKQKRIIRVVKGAAGIKKKGKPFLPENGLSIVERYFHHMPPQSAQVVLVYGGGIIMPKGAKHLSVDRIVSIMKMTSAEIYRTACLLNYETQEFTPMGTSAADIRIVTRFTELVDETTVARTAQQELNQKYDVGSGLLWNIHIVGPKEMQGEGINAPPDDDNFIFPKFYIFWSFHHCISDGLSGWCYIRHFMTKMGPELFQPSPPNLQSVLITTTPPPLIDNLISTNFIGLIPAFFDALFQLMAKSRFKSSRLKNLVTERLPLELPPIPGVEPPTASNVKFFSFDAAFSEALRLNCRKNKTTIASAVIVAALAAVRSVFRPRSETQKKKLPSHQAWVVTSSIRMLIPNSRLLEGADKEQDPGLMEFGGYGGSITHECFKFGKRNDLWERCRTVKRHLSGSFLKSLRRVKLINFLFRKNYWKKLQAKVDIDDITRSYSVEVANLGSWKSPYAPNTAREDLAKADWFAGTLNNSFLGARALFTVALISINNVMSFTVSYDMTTISAAEGDLFVEGITHALEQMKSSPGGKITVGSLNK